MDGAPGAADGGRARVREFDGDAGLGAPPDAGSGAGAVAAGAGYRGDASCQRGPRPGPGPAGAAVAVWPAVALVGCYELLMMVIRSSQAVTGGIPCSAVTSDPLGEQAAEIFAGQLAADRVPSVRAIRAQFHVGQSRAQRLRDYLAAGTGRGTESPAA